MKALTISQPFASLIASGEKFIENRTWRTSFRGQLAIHAGKGTQYLTRQELSKVPHGCVLAIGNLTACVRLSEIRERDQDPQRRLRLIAGTNKSWSQAARHAHAEGPWCWIIEDVREIEPVECKGAQQFWNWEQP